MPLKGDSAFHLPPWHLTVIEAVVFWHIGGANDLSYLMTWLQMA